MNLSIKGKLPAQPEPDPPSTDPPRPATRLARMLALAHLIERKVESGQLKDYAEAARTLGISRARMTQVMNLLVLSPKVQEAVLLGKGFRSERSVRAVLGTPSWREQAVEKD